MQLAFNKKIITSYLLRIMKSQGTSNYCKTIYIHRIRFDFFLRYNGIEKILVFVCTLSRRGRSFPVARFMMSDAIPGMYRHIKNRIVRLEERARIWQVWYHFEQLPNRALVRARINQLLASSAKKKNEGLHIFSFLTTRQREYNKF